MSDTAMWAFGVTAAAILTAIVRNLAGHGAMGTLVQFLGGIFLVLTVISPLMQLELPDPEQWMADYRHQGELAVQDGQQMADEKTRELIKARVEAYILDKAAAHGASLTVDVRIDENGIPAAVTLRGNISPAVRSALARMMESELGIGREAQQWTG